MADALVLDTSACFAFLEDEAGADVVESYLVEAKEGRMVIHLSFATRSQKYTHNAFISLFSFADNKTRLRQMRDPDCIIRIGVLTLDSFMLVVVLPQPPFWLVTAIIRIHTPFKK